MVRFDKIAKECREVAKGPFVDVPIVGLEHIEPYDMLLKNWDVNVETTFTKIFKKGQILFGRRRAYQHKACVATCDGICSGDITVIEPIVGAVCSDLLPFIVQNDDFFEHAIKGSNGALSPRVKWEHMASFEIKLPSIEQQKALADKLWAAYEVKQSYLRMIEATEKMVKSQFIEMFGNRNKGNVLTVEKVASALFAGGDKPKNMSPKKSDQYKYPVWANGIGENGLMGYSKSYKVDKTSLTISARGTIGCCTIREPYFTPVVRLITLVPNDCVNVVYLKYYFENVGFDHSGAVQGQLTIPDLKKKEVYVPPMMRQQRFAEIVHQADKSEFELKKTIEAIDKVIKSLINENL